MEERGREKERNWGDEEKSGMMCVERVKVRWKETELAPSDIFSPSFASVFLCVCVCV